jgi:hypothetical protein
LWKNLKYFLEFRGHHTLLRRPAPLTLVSLVGAVCPLNRPEQSVAPQERHDPLTASPAADSRVTWHGEARHPEHVASRSCG